MSYTVDLQCKGISLPSKHFGPTLSCFSSTQACCYDSKSFEIDIVIGRHLAYYRMLVALTKHFVMKCRYITSIQHVKTLTLYNSCLLRWMSKEPAEVSSTISIYGPTSFLRDVIRSLNVPPKTVLFANSSIIRLFLSLDNLVELFPLMGRQYASTLSIS